jgi:putative peptidoglycan lipid II flippase
VTTSQALVRAGLIVSVAFFVSRILGWFRVVVFGVLFGAGPELDAFYAAFRLPDLMFQLVAAGALSSAVDPIVAGLVATEEHARAWRVISTIANLMLGALVVIGAIVFLFAPLIVPLLTPGFDDAQLARTVELTRIMVLSPIFLALGSLATSVLNANGRFAAAAVAPIVYNLAIIGGAIILAPSFGVAGLAFAVVGGSIGHLLVQLPAVRRLGYGWVRRIDLADPAARQTLALMAPRALGLGVTQITFVVVTSLASLIGDGAITAFNVAFTLLQIPVGVIGVPLGVVVLPSLSREAAVGRTDEFVALVSRALRLLLYVMLPITGLVAVLRTELVTILFGYGRFGAEAIELTSITLLAFLGGLAAHALIAVLARAFYARQDTRTPVTAAIVAVAVNTALAVLLSGPLGLPGLALAIAIGAWVEAAMLTTLLKLRVPELPLAPVVGLGLRALLASVAATAVAFGLGGGLTMVMGEDPSRLAILVRVVVVGTVWLVTYLGLSAVLRITELGSIVGLMADLLKRPRRA